MLYKRNFPGWKGYGRGDGRTEARWRGQKGFRDLVDVLTINTVIPLLHAYGTATGDTSMSDAAVEMLHALRAENNSVVALFVKHGVKCDDAFTSQALLQLRREYCEPRKCLYCRIGHKMLSRHTKSPDPR